MGAKCETQICRLCLATTATRFSLVENDEISAMLEALTSLRITSTDHISTIMCLKCRLNLKLAFTIQQNMLKAEQRFRERLLSSIKQECDFVLNKTLDIATTTLTETKTEKVEIEPNKKDSVDIEATVLTETKSKKGKSKHNKNDCIDSETTVLLVKKITSKKGKSEERDTSVVPTYTCDICGIVKPSKHSLRKHSYAHIKRKCPICGKEISSPNYSHHVSRHTLVESLCELCGKSVRKQDLRFHLAKKHGGPKYKCDYCDKLLWQKSYKIAHEQREHLNVANYVCDACGKKFYQAIFLKKHIDCKHLKLRPYVCEFCKVAFSTRTALRTHRRQHTNETPYKCEVCGDGFRQKVSLRTHLKSKHKIKEELTIECKECGKMFASKAALIAHGRIH